MERLLDVMRTLRGPGGCPWDREQTHESLRPYLLEEAAEAVDALGSGDSGEVAEELGDVLLQVAFHAVVAEEAGTFGYADIESAIVDKLVRRHPHVFGDVKVSGADEVVSNWQAIKALEKGSNEGPDAGVVVPSVPSGLPALLRSAKLGKALAWPAPSAEELRARLDDFVARPDAETLGALLLAVALQARAAGLEPETALRDAAEGRARAAAAP
jgi:XTP/dITP diphosphohydrolase